MKITKEKDLNGYDEIKMFEDNMIFTISFGGNGDLYWDLRNTEDIDMESKEESFRICKDDGLIYDLFQTLYYRVSNHQIFQVKKDKEAFCRNEELSKHPYFEMLCDGEYIEWHSDNEPFETGNRLFMFYDSVTGEIVIKINIVSRRYDFLDVCFSNSGSRCMPFHIAFYEHYKELCERDLTLNSPNEDTDDSVLKGTEKKLMKTVN